MHKITIFFVLLLLCSCGRNATPEEPDIPEINHPCMIIPDSSLKNIKDALSTGANIYATQIHQIIITNANAALNADELTYSKPDGKRLLEVSRTAEKQILSCVYAYRISGNNAYLERARKDLTTVCNFPDWNAPTHYLDVGEMCVAVGLAYDWLYDELDKELKERIENALYNYAILPFMNAYKSGGYKSGHISMDFIKATSNWNQVCSAGQVIAAIALGNKFPDEMKFIIDKCVSGNKNSVSQMYDGGTYPEGYIYWTYGTAFQCLLNMALETAFSNDYGLCQDCLTASSKYFMHMESPIQANFGYSDGNSGWIAGLPMWYFADRTDNSDILFDELLKLNAGKYQSSEEVRVLPLFMPCVANINISSPKAPAEQFFHQGTVQPLLIVKTGWTKSDSYKWLGIKGGKANTNHGHMDAGSFVYDAYGVRWIRDYGGGTYANFEAAAAKEGKNYWDMGQNSFRWTVGIVNNRTHSTISVNGKDHKVSALAAFSSTINTATEKGGTIDLTEVLNGEVAKAIRTVKLVNDNDLVIIDEVEALSGKDANMDWRILTPAKVSVSQGGILLTNGSKKMTLKTAVDNKETSISYTTYNSVINSYDVDLEKAGYCLCGFKATIKSGQTATFTTTISLAE